MGSRSRRFHSRSSRRPRVPPDRGAAESARSGLFFFFFRNSSSRAFARFEDSRRHVRFRGGGWENALFAFATARNPHRAARSPVPSTHAASFERPREAFRALSRSRFTSPATSRARNPRRPLSAKDAFSCIGAESDKLAQLCSPRRPASTRRRRAASRLVRAERRAPLAARRVSASATRAASSTSPARCRNPLPRAPARWNAPPLAPASPGPTRRRRRRRRAKSRWSSR